MRYSLDRVENYGAKIQKRVEICSKKNDKTIGGSIFSVEN